jgi:hypothetical protein
MATNLATIVVELQSKTASFQNQFSQATDTVKKKTTELTQATNKTVAGSKNLQESFRKASQSIAAIQGPLGPVAGRITSLGTIIGNVGLKTAITTLAIAGFAFALRATVSIASNAERQFGKLEGILRATGNAAGLTIEEIENLAQEIGRETLASTQGVRDAAGVLLTFKSITGETFKDALRLSQDLAEVGFGSVSSAALQLGKALEDPTVGLSALKRVGVSFTEQQKEQIQTLDFLGEKQKSQVLVLKAINEQVGKTGPRAAKGLAGAVDTLNEEFTLFIETNNLVQNALGATTFLLKGLNKVFGDTKINFRALSETKLSDELAKINDLIEKQIPLAEKEKDSIFGFKVQQKALNNLLKNRAEIQDELNKKIEERNRLEEEEKKGPKPFELLLNDLAKKRELSNKREIEDLGKTEQELRVLNEARKIEDALLSKKIKDQSVIDRLVKTQTDEIRKQAIETQKLVDQQKNLDAIGDGLASTFRTAGDAIVDAFLRGEKGSINFKNILREVLIGIQKTIINVLILEQIEKQIRASVSGKGGFLGSIFKSITGIFGGGDQTATQGSSATGGSVQSNRSVLVGERGPELFVPRTAGSITPSSLTPGKMGGGGGVTIQQNLNFATGIQNTVRAEVLNLLPQIQQSTIAAVADAKLRGGKFSKAFGA